MAKIVPQEFEKKLDKKEVAVFWFRRDLRLHDNAGLYNALKSDHPVLPLFIFDTNILDDLENKADARVEFIHDNIKDIHNQLEDEGSSMLVTYGKPKEIFEELTEVIDIKAVYTNRDYEPYALSRDEEIETLLSEKDIPFQTFKDHLIFEKKEVVKDDGDPYVVFTPYSKTWKEKLASGIPKGEGDDLSKSEYLEPYPSEDHMDNAVKAKPISLLELEDIGFESTEIEFPPDLVKQGLIKDYKANRNFPAKKGTSRLSVHFRFGTISIREKVKKAIGLSEAYLTELIWREFYAMILANFPYVVDRPFRKKYEFIEWRDNEDDFKAWCEGKTGYPIVDAGMRELNNTGFMHNRVRMITASFLTKHLLIDWRKGEAYFAGKLLDYELASNNGGWQWAAGCGTDAAPYFRIFNPYTQREKFDKNWEYVKKWVPEYDTDDYPEPIVEHKFARERCLETYKEGLDKASD